jgi:sarcosine oxidase subunit delta
MRIPCPLCGERDLREFAFLGSEAYLHRPGDAAWGPEWDAYLHLRENPAGEARELWHHGAGCGAWLIVERDTTTHAVGPARLAGDAAQS